MLYLLEILLSVYTERPPSLKGTDYIISPLCLGEPDV